MVQGLEAPTIGQLAAQGGVVLYELTPQEVSLEEAYMELTQDSVEFHAASGAGTPAPSSTGGR